MEDFCELCVMFSIRLAFRLRVVCCASDFSEATMRRLLSKESRCGLSVFRFNKSMQIHKCA